MTATFHVVPQNSAACDKNGEESAYFIDIGGPQDGLRWTFSPATVTVPLEPFFYGLEAACSAPATTVTATITNVITNGDAGYWGPSGPFLLNPPGQPTVEVGTVESLGLTLIGQPPPTPSPAPSPTSAPTPIPTPTATPTPLEVGMNATLIDQNGNESTTPNSFEDQQVAAGPIIAGGIGAASHQRRPESTATFPCAVDYKMTQATGSIKAAIHATCSAASKAV